MFVKRVGILGMRVRECGFEDCYVAAGFRVLPCGLAGL